MGNEVETENEKKIIRNGIAKWLKANDQKNLVHNGNV